MPRLLMFMLGSIDYMAATKVFSDFAILLGGLPPPRPPSHFLGGGLPPSPPDLPTREL